MRRAAKVDANQREIVEALRDRGCSVQSLAMVGKGCPDLLVGVGTNPFACRNILLEVKDGSKVPSAQKLTPDEEKWICEWRGQVAVVRNVEEALIAVGILERRSP